MGFPSKHGFTAKTTPCFQPCQIVCLEHETSRLYAEVIQIIESRQICWVRPLMLTLWVAEALTWEATQFEQPNCYDLRQDSDLLLPLTLFRAALDTEVMPWIANFYSDDRDTGDQQNQDGRGHQQFKEFVQRLWQAHPDVFQSRSALGST